MHYYPAPAKINRLLRIVKQEEDGYHYLQTIFQFTDLYDEIGFCLNSDRSDLQFRYPHIDFALEDDLIYRAIQALMPYHKKNTGLTIDLKKRLPMGAGLGGGSSNAATTLIVLNQLWKLNFTKEQLIKIGSTLGADVPIFIYGISAWAEGRGDRFTPINPPEEKMLLVNPNIKISTQTIFNSVHLNRNNPRLDLSDNNSDDGMQINDCKSAIFFHYPAMKEYMDHLDNLNLNPQITGTGSCIFIREKNINSSNRAKLEELANKNDWEILEFNTVNHNCLFDQLG